MRDGTHGGYRHTRCRVSIHGLMAAKTLYGHQQRWVTVQVGQTVVSEAPKIRGEWAVRALAARAPTFHFEIHPGGRGLAANPLPSFFPGRGLNKED